MLMGNFAAGVGGIVLLLPPSGEQASKSNRTHADRTICFMFAISFISILLNAKVVRIWEIYKFIMVHFAQNLIFLCLFPLFLMISLSFLPYEHNTFNVGEGYRILYIRLQSSFLLIIKGVKGMLHRRTRCG